MANNKGLLPITAARRLLLGGLARVARLKPSRLTRPTLVVVIAAWLAMGACAVAILVWAALDPPWLIGDASPFLLTVLILLPTTVAIILMTVLTPMHDRTIRLKSLLFLLVLGSLVPSRALLADGVVVLAAVSLGTAVIGLVLIVLAARQPEPKRYLLVSAGVATWLGWLIAFIHDHNSPLESSTWIFLLAVAYPIFSITVIFGVAEAAESRFGRISQHIGRKYNLLAVGVLIVAKCAFLAWRFTGGRNLFGTVDARLWSLRSWSSWPHAFLVAALFVGLVLRSQARPIIQRGSAVVIAALAVGAASAEVAALADQLVSTIQVSGPLVSAVLGEGTSVPLATNQHFFNKSHWLGPAAVAALVLAFTLWPGLRGTRGHHLALVAGLYLIPPLGAIALLEEKPRLNVPDIWSTPVQVDIGLTAIVVGLTLASAVSRRALVDESVLIRILVAPILAIHAALSLPHVFDAPLVVVGTLAGLFLLLPPAASDRSKHSSTVLRASVTQLGVLGLYMLVLTANLEDTAVTSLVAILNLAIPVSFAICLSAKSAKAPMDVDLRQPDAKGSTVAEPS